jgi:hypothetical protein
MSPQIRLLALVVLIGILAAGSLMVFKWQSPPAEKLAAAEKAVNDARSAGAPTFLPDDFGKLEGMLGEARKAIADETAKLGFLRNYEKSEELLSAVLTEAGRLMAEARKREEEAKAAALQAQRDAQEAVTAAQELARNAPVGKDRAALLQIKADLQTLAAALPGVQKALDARDYQGARAKAEDIRVKAQAVAAELQRALDKVKKASRKKASH